MCFYPTGLVLVGIFSLKRVRNIDFFKERCHNQVNSKNIMERVGGIWYVKKYKTTSIL